jgi:anti-sigma factor ChrR (cupin superfamily)
MRRPTLWISAVLLAALAIGAKAGAGTGRKVRMVTADRVQFKDAEGMPGLQIAPLWGDMSKNGDWGSLIKFKAGTDVGWHTHTGGTQLVVVSGTLIVEPEGGAPGELTSGAYAEEPATVKHRTVCKEGEDCVFLLHMTKRFDFLKAKEPAPAAAGGATSK